MFNLLFKNRHLNCLCAEHSKRAQQTIKMTCLTLLAHKNTRTLNSWSPYVCKNNQWHNGLHNLSTTHLPTQFPVASDANYVVLSLTEWPLLSTQLVQINYRIMHYHIIITYTIFQFKYNNKLAHCPYLSFGKVDQCNNLAMWNVAKWEAIPN